MITTEWPSPEYPNRVPFLVRQVELLRQQGVQIDVFHFEGKKQLLNYLRAGMDIRAKLRTNQYDLVHAQWGQSAFPVIFTLLPLVVTFRGSDIYGATTNRGAYSFLGRVLAFFSRQVVSRRATALVLVSRQMEALIPRYILKKTTVIPSGIDLELFKPMDKTQCRTELGLSHEIVLILFGSSPSRPEKRYDLAAEAVHTISAEIPCQMIVAANIPHSLMPTYLNAVDLVVLTSVHEGSPNIVKEALACNTPIVSVNVGDVAERLNGLDGCEIADASVVELANSIRSVLKRKRPFEGRQSIMSLNEKHLTDQLIRVYKRVIV